MVLDTTDHPASKLAPVRDPEAAFPRKPGHQHDNEIAEVPTDSPANFIPFEEL